jgi:hypothetical protein
VDIFLKNGMMSSSVSVIENIANVKAEWFEFASKFEGHTLMRFVAVLLKTVNCSDHSEIISRAVRAALDSLKDELSLEFLSCAIDHLGKSEINEIGGFIAAANYPTANNIHLVKLAGRLAGRDDIGSNDLQKYAHRRILWLTKYFSERTTIADSEKNFLNVFGE